MNNEQKTLKVGDRVKIISLPAYIKTAEPMPMLRPPHLLTVGEEGIIMERRPGGYWGIRFTQGAFLLESQHFAVISE
jgi:hypothetical protein